MEIIGKNTQLLLEHYATWCRRLIGIKKGPCSATMIGSKLRLLEWIDSVVNPGLVCQKCKVSLHYVQVGEDSKSGLLEEGQRIKKGIASRMAVRTLVCVFVGFTETIRDDCFFCNERAQRLGVSHKHSGLGQNLTPHGCVVSRRCLQWPKKQPWSTERPWLQRGQSTPSRSDGVAWTLEFLEQETKYLQE